MWFKKNDRIDSSQDKPYKWVKTPTPERKIFEEALVSSIFNVPADRWQYDKVTGYHHDSDPSCREWSLTGLGAKTDTGLHIVLYHEAKAIDVYNKSQRMTHSMSSYTFQIYVDNACVATYKYVPNERSLDESYKGIQAIYEHVARAHYQRMMEQVTKDDEARIASMNEMKAQSQVREKDFRDNILRKL